MTTDDGQKVFTPKKNGLAVENVTGFSIHPELISITSDPSECKEISSADYTTDKGIVKESFYQGKC